MNKLPNSVLKTDRQQCMFDRTVLRQIELALLYEAVNNEIWVRGGGHYICLQRAGVYVNGQEFETLASGIEVINKADNPMILFLYDQALSHESLIAAFGTLKEAGLKKLHAVSLDTYG